MNIDKEILLADAKKEETGMKEKIDPDGRSKNSVDLLLRSFNYFLNNCNNPGGDYENREFAKGIYSVIGWDDERYFDVINSFYTNFESALVFCGVFNQNTPTEYSFDESNSFCYRTVYGMNPIGKKKLVGKMVDPRYKCAKSLPLFMESEIGKTAQKFAALCYCIANFMPCPDGEFNSAKGLLNDVKDYFPLMVDKIQQCVKDESKLVYSCGEKDVVVQFNTIVNWHKWLIDNREKYCLDSYYKIENGNIAGIPLYENQSLENPRPTNVAEVKKCLEAVINRINVRADLILKRYQPKP